MGISKNLEMRIAVAGMVWSCHPLYGVGRPQAWWIGADTQFTPAEAFECFLADLDACDDTIYGPIPGCDTLADATTTLRHIAAHVSSFYDNTAEDLKLHNAWAAAVLPALYDNR